MAERRWVAPEHLSPRYKDGIPRRHQVAPVQIYFDPGRGHYYSLWLVPEHLRPRRGERISAVHLLPAGADSEPARPAGRRASCPAARSGA